MLYIIMLYIYYVHHPFMNSMFDKKILYDTNLCGSTFHYVLLFSFTFVSLSKFLHRSACICLIIFHYSAVC